MTRSELAHHGSRNGLNESWMELVHPKPAVISCGAGNPYGHPGQQVLDLFEEHEIPVGRRMAKR